MNKFTPEAFEPLDEEERELMESIERDEWTPVANFEEEKEKAMQSARNTIERSKRIDLYLSQKDYHQIQIKAVEEGMPSEVLIASIIHKYLNGSLAPVENNPGN